MSYEVRLNKYNALLTPNELLTFMDENIYYGVYGKDQKLYLYDDDNFQQACLKEYILSDKDRLLKYQYGTCWDQVIGLQEIIINLKRFLFGSYFLMKIIILHILIWYIRIKKQRSIVILNTLILIIGEYINFQLIKKR